MAKKISIDDFFKEEANKGFLCTIEQVKNEPGKVKLTPWLDGKNTCNCEASITVDKDLIEDIVVTDDIHFCCGEKHKIIEVFFKENASLKLKDVLDKVVADAHSKKAAVMQPNIRPLFNQVTSNAGRQATRMSAMQPCGSGSYNPDTQCCCYNPVSGQTFVSTRQFSGQSDYCCCDPGLCTPALNKLNKPSVVRPLDDSLCCGYYGTNGFPTAGWMSYDDCRAINGWALDNSACGH